MLRVQTPKRKENIMKLLNAILILTLGIFTSSLKADVGINDRAELKAKLVELASSYTGKTRLKDEALKQIKPLVDALVGLSEKKSEADKKDLVIGGWRNVWSYRNFGFNTNYDQVYQIVSEDGYYYNFSEIALGKVKFSGFLRGKYEDAGDKLRIEFTSNKIKFGFYEEGTDIVELIESFEAGEIRALSIPGPIGIQGDLVNLYVDDTLRIVTGRTDGGGVEDLFILTRTDLVLKD